MKRLALYFVIMILLAITSSCDKGTQGSRTLLPNVTGTAGEVVVVLEDEVREEKIGKTYRDILEEEFPMIPQSEPLFNVVMISPKAFTNIFRSHRNIIITKVSSEFQESQIFTQRDVWAAPQTILNIVGPTYPAIAEMMQNEKNRIVQILEQAERDRVAQNAKKFEAEGIRDFLKKKFSISMSFPKGYNINLDTTNFAWISYETPSISQGIFIYEYPYTDANTFTADYLVEQRNSFVHKYVPGPSKGSYMTTETIIPPRYTPLMYKGRFFGQLRGLWDVYAHPMGGPFVSLTTIDETRNRVITVDAYVYAPRFNKRNYVRQVEALLLTLEILEDKEKN